jgi:shikimate kinase
MSTPAVGNVVLIGYRGSGKSAVGARLAVQLGWRHVDTDDQIVAATGQSIRTLFEQRGEAAFRRLEADAVAVAVEDEHQVLSVGGGAILTEANRTLLRQAGLVVWLTAPAEELWQRIRNDERAGVKRPALTALHGAAEVAHLLAERTPLYAATAHATVDTAGRSIDRVVEAIMALLGQQRSLTQGR